MHSCYGRKSSKIAAVFSQAKSPWAVYVKPKYLWQRWTVFFSSHIEEERGDTDDGIQ